MKDKDTWHSSNYSLSGPGTRHLKNCLIHHHSLGASAEAACARQVSQCEWWLEKCSFTSKTHSSHKSPLCAHSSYTDHLLCKEHTSTSWPHQHRSVGLPPCTDSRLNMSDTLTRGCSKGERWLMTGFLNCATADTCLLWFVWHTVNLALHDASRHATVCTTRL